MPRENAGAESVLVFCLSVSSYEVITQNKLQESYQCSAHMRFMSSCLTGFRFSGSRLPTNTVTNYFQVIDKSQFGSVFLVERLY